MELSLREWIMVASAVAMAGILGHALWLRWRSRRNRLRLEIDPTVAQVSEVDELDLLRGELPNGGARVVAGKVVGKDSAGKPRHGRAGPDTARDPAPAEPDADVPPVLMDPVTGARRVEPEVGADAADDDPVAVPVGTEEERVPPKAVPSTRGEVERTTPGIGDRGGERGGATDRAGTSGASDPAGAGTVQGGGTTPGGGSTGTSARTGQGTGAQGAGPGGRPGVRRVPEPSIPQAAPEPQVDHEEDDDAEDGEGAEVSREHLIVMQVLARDHDGFGVGAVVTRVSNAGMTFGDFNIFHRYKGGRVNRKFIEYSMANAVEPGVFDLSDGGARTRGVAFFMQLPVPSEPMAVFDDMLRVATDLANALDGELRDDRHGVITAQTIEHCRERIREFNRRRQIRT